MVTLINAPKEFITDRCQVGAFLFNGRVPQNVQVKNCLFRYWPLNSKEVGLIKNWPAYIYIADYLGHRCHNRSCFGGFLIHESLSSPVPSNRLLWYITFQHGVPDSHYPRGLLNLSTYQLQVGFYHRGSIMRRCDKVQSVHRHLQLPTRLHCSSTAYAHTVESANDCE